mmetsp:Transcript_14383/g.31097  ORF Transcript_14383/g.31097 Transcript_14383/m.31097 type:complete len:825 (+) Transcript_14383:68-2542(+)|eukprot:CAMPEP_0202893238 /NCGR_PEP_ID=MMETSP1392-20130828/2846_1 /ASSEMBLY_ACC=CAM_ASM_000868 /TAXON_ID=225041 /ORGANISM="Chlamydomonas chlamydogama, Strain SAG 11-48b" /LENGTH=824 /DNA_ID=CAMNT_0049577491 /DNA_START=57 /DNA_END=2531 /DNA_ORIENTATION=-
MGKGGESVDTQQTSSVLEDERFLPFKQDNFNVAEFTSRVLTGSHTTAQAQSEQLRDGVRVLEAELSSEVITRNKDLLGNVRRVLDVENSLQDLGLSVESLQSAVRRIRAEIVTPYELVKTKTRQLRNLHGTVDLLRHLIHRLKLAQKLRQQLAAPPGSIDLAKAAKLITDIRAVDQEVDLTGIDAVAADDTFLSQASTAVRAQAEEALVDGMESLSQAKVGSALQVFFNLEELSQAVSSLTSKYIHDLEKAVKAALDARHLGATTGVSVGLLGGPSAGRTVGSPGAGANTSWQDKLWQALKEVADQLQTSATAVWHLQRVVAKKKDPLSHVCFLDVLVKPEDMLLTQKFWSDAVKVLTDAFAAVSKPGKGVPVRDTLVSGYPKLAHLLEGMYERLATETTMKGVLPAVVPEQLQQLLGAAAPFQAAYLAGCLSRMSDAVMAAFPGGARSLPSPADVQKCIGIMHEELKVAGSSKQLATMIAATVGKAMLLLAEKAEYMAATGPDVRAVAAGTPANPAQLRNIALCSQLQEVHRSLSSLLPRLPQTASPALQNALDAIQATAIECVAPIFKAAMEALEDRVLRMHSLNLRDQPGSGGGDAGAATATGPGSKRVSSDGGQGAKGVGMVNTSGYVNEAANLIASFRSEFLSKFVPVPSPNVASCVSTLVERMACRLLIFFVRHASLVRPLGQVGKLQIAKDMAELQLCVGLNLFPLEQLGLPYRVMKAFRALLFQDTPGILSSPLLKELPASITLHHLFSRLPASVQAPHERSSLSPAQYSLWLDQHSMQEVLDSVSAALDAAGPVADPAASEVVAIMRALCTGLPL